MKTNFSNISDFKSAVANDNSLKQALINDPLNTIENIHQTPLDYDVWIYRVVVIALGSGVLSIIIGVIILVGTGRITDDKNVPTILTAIGSAAIGALAGLLAPSPKNTK